jgi:hypothetical protein
MPKVPELGEETVHDDSSGSGIDEHCEVLCPRAALDPHQIQAVRQVIVKES